MENFLADKLNEDDFRHQWLTTLQMDSALRSKQEFNLLDSLYGDVDQALTGINSRSTLSIVKLKDKVSELLKQLK